MAELTNELYTEIKTDITGGQELVLEPLAFEALKKLKEHGKMCDEEITDLYRTHYKELFGRIDSDTRLLEVQKNLARVTQELLSTYLTEKKESTVPEKVKNAIYRACSIDHDIVKNSTGANIAKGVIDEILSVPEMFYEAISHPIDFGTGLYTALVKNFSETIAVIKKQYTDAFHGIDTPQKAYESGKSGVLILLTLIPGVLGKTLLRIGKSITKRGTKAGAGVAKAAPRATESVVNTVKNVTDKAASAGNRLKETQVAAKSIAVGKNIATQAKKAKHVAHGTQKTAELAKDPIIEYVHHLNDA